MAPVSASGASAVRFPRGFLWGTATAAFQTEMGRGRNVDCNSDWYAWTHNAANLASGRVSADKPEQGPGEYALFRQDARLVRHNLRSNAFRFSIEWSRIFPRSTAAVHVGSRITVGDLRNLDKLANHAAVRHYRAELEAIVRSRMTPFVTVNHFTLPLWVHDPIATRDALANVGLNDSLPAGLKRAGWLDPSTVVEFRKYAAYLAWKYGDLVRFWLPINEPLVVVEGGYVNIPGPPGGGSFPPGALSARAAVAALQNLERANAAAYDAIHRFDRHARVGLVQNMVAFTPANPGSAADVAAAKDADYLFNRLFVNAAVRGVYDANGNGTIEPSERHPSLAHKADFLGVNYYLRGRVAAAGGPLTPVIPAFDFLPQVAYSWVQQPGAPRCPTTCSDFGSEIYPQGFEQVLRTAGSYHLPVYVTENGIADGSDARRPAYLVQHLLALRRAMKRGYADVRGYFHWSLVDNFEWAAGYTPKFGLFSFSPTTLHRRARPSAFLLRSIAGGDAIPAELVRRYGG
ncbi:MAG: family 1 glycosylhydrolase [Thermoleophilaceae bacterium]